ncbi:hypothetical protein Gasu2_49990 [Galdieria sulphuraria]|nr:hypothetical protein Gasu2_49990 [Galdieria sulphuraria]
MRNLTESQQSVVRHLSIALGSLSMAISLFVIVFHLLRRRTSVTGGKRRIDEPVLWLSFACFFAPLFNMHLGSFGDSFCSIEAAGNQFFYLSSFVWVTCIAHQLYTVFVRNNSRASRKHSLIYHGLGWGFPAVTVIILLLSGKFDNSASENSYEWCWITENSWKFALFYVPLFILLAINVVVYVVIVIIVYKRYRSMLGLRKSFYPAATTRSTFARQTIFWALRVSLYLMVFIVTRIGSLINRFYELTHQGYSPFGLMVLHAVTQSLQGFLFGLIYIYHERALGEVILLVRSDGRNDTFMTLEKRGLANFSRFDELEEEEEEDAESQNFSLADKRFYNTIIHMVTSLDLLSHQQLNQILKQLKILESNCSCSISVSFKSLYVHILSKTFVVLREGLIFDNVHEETLVERKTQKSTLKREPENKETRKSYLDFVANFCDETEIGAILESLFERKEFQEAFSVFNYVHSHKLNLPIRIIKSAVDAAIKERNITLLYQILGWLKRTGLARKFGSRTVIIPKFTRTQSEYSSLSKISLKNVNMIVPQNFSSMKSGRSAFPSGPVMSDTLFGLCFLGFLGVGLSMELINPLILHHEDWEPTVFLLLIFFGLAADRYMGSGKVYRSVERGLRRIFTDDAVRTSRCEAAFLLSGYLLGIPYLFFQPNGEALIRHHRTLLELVVNTENDSLESMTSLSLAAESAIDGLFFEINPDKIWRFVDKLDESMWTQFGCRKEDWKDCKRFLLERAYSDAEQILNAFCKEHLFLADKMLSGASAGECIVSLERVL